MISRSTAPALGKLVPAVFRGAGEVFVGIIPGRDYSDVLRRCDLKHQYNTVDYTPYADDGATRLSHGKTKHLPIHGPKT